MSPSRRRKMPRPRGGLQIRKAQVDQGARGRTRTRYPAPTTVAVCIQRCTTEHSDEMGTEEEGIAVRWAEVARAGAAAWTAACGDLTCAEEAQADVMSLGQLSGRLRWRGGIGSEPQAPGVETAGGGSASHAAAASRVTNLGGLWPRAAAPRRLVIWRTVDGRAPRTLGRGP